MAKTTCFPCSRRHSIGVLLCLLAGPVFSQVTNDAADKLLQRQRQREEAQRLQQEATTDVHLAAPTSAVLPGYPDGETPCFVIREVRFDGDQTNDFGWALAAANPALGRCLGSIGINSVVGEVQNALIGRGYITSRVLAAPQDLLSGRLLLKLVPGRIRTIRFAGAVSSQGYASALPARTGEILNLRQIEQGLENFKRIPGADADIQIVPGELPGESDLLIKSVILRHCQVP